MQTRTKKKKNEGVEGGGAKENKNVRRKMETAAPL